MGAIEPGMVIAGYRFEQQIGAGGMGIVYRAVHAKLGRKAAVKVLADSLANNPEYLSRFFREARIVGEVGHPNIIDILDFVELDAPRVVAYVMELIEGPSLGQVLKSQKLSPVQAINVTLQLIDALLAVHAIGVIHRDLKPENVLVVGGLDTDLAARPCIKVLDFGIAKVNHRDASQSHHTTTGMVLGTPAYMAPEQVAADPVSSGTDVYAIGELLFEMLTGQRLFVGDNMAILRAKVSADPPAIELPLELIGSAKLSSLIRACLAHDQTKRPSLLLLSSALRDVLEQQPTVAKKMGLEAAPPTAVANAPLLAPSLDGEESTVSHPIARQPSRAQVPAAPGVQPRTVAIALAVVLALVMATLGGVMVVRETEPIVILPLEPEPLPEPPTKKSMPMPEKHMDPMPEKQMEMPAKKKPVKRNDALKKDEFPAW